MKHENSDPKDSDNLEYGRQQNREGEDAHDHSEKNPNWGDDHRAADPKFEEERTDDRIASQQKSDNQSADSEHSRSESTHPDHKKDTQSNQSEDPTRKNEANQGTSDLRTRERTNFKREGESREDS